MAWVIAIVQVSITFVKDYFNTIQGFSILMIIFQTFQGLENILNIFQTFPGSVRTLYCDPGRAPAPCSYGYVVYQFSLRATRVSATVDYFTFLFACIKYSLHLALRLNKSLLLQYIVWNKYLTFKKYNFYEITLH